MSEIVLVILIIAHYVWHLPVPAWLWWLFGVAVGIKFLFNLFIALLKEEMKHK